MRQSEGDSRGIGAFVVIYRWHINPGRETDFIAAWQRVTCAIREHCGSGGSALFRDQDGTYVGIARWPDRETRDRCVGIAADDFRAMRDCIADSRPEQRLDLITDLWTR